MLLAEPPCSLDSDLYSHSLLSNWRYCECETSPVQTGWRKNCTSLCAAWMCVIESKLECWQAKTFEIPEVISYSSGHYVRPDHLGSPLKSLSHPWTCCRCLHHIQSASQWDRIAMAWPWSGLCGHGPLCAEEMMRPNRSSNRIWVLFIQSGICRWTQVISEGALVRWDWMRFYSRSLNIPESNVTVAAVAPRGAIAYRLVMLR